MRADFCGSISHRRGKASGLPLAFVLRPNLQVIDKQRLTAKRPAVGRAEASEWACLDYHNVARSAGWTSRLPAATLYRKVSLVGSGNARRNAAARRRAWWHDFGVHGHEGAQVPTPSLYNGSRLVRSPPRF